MSNSLLRWTGGGATGLLVVVKAQGVEKNPTSTHTALENLGIT